MAKISLHFRVVESISRSQLLLLEENFAIVIAPSLMIHFYKQSEDSHKI